jgi:hypothetical protein
MKVLRAGGEFADRHIRRRGKKAILYFICFIAICAVFFFSAISSSPYSA